MSIINYQLTTTYRYATTNTHMYASTISDMQLTSKNIFGIKIKLNASMTYENSKKYYQLCVLNNEFFNFPIFTLISCRSRVFNRLLCVGSLDKKLSFIMKYFVVQHKMKTINSNGILQSIMHWGLNEWLEDKNSDSPSFSCSWWWWCPSKCLLRWCKLA